MSVSQWAKKINQQTNSPHASKQTWMDFREEMLQDWVLCHRIGVEFPKGYPLVRGLLIPKEWLNTSDLVIVLFLCLRRNWNMIDGDEFFYHGITSVKWERV